MKSYKDKHEERKQLAEMVAQGKSCAEVAKETGFSTYQVKVACVENDVQSPYNRSRLQMPEVCKIIYRLMHTNESLSGIARKLQLPLISVRKTQKYALDAGLLFTPRVKGRPKGS